MGKKKLEFEVYRVFVFKRPVSLFEISNKVDQVDAFNIIKFR